MCLVELVDFSINILNINLLASDPISYLGILIVVNAGVMRSTNGMSLYPTTLMSFGHFSFLSANSSYNPMANKSLAANIAVIFLFLFSKNLAPF